MKRQIGRGSEQREGRVAEEHKHKQTHYTYTHTHAKKVEYFCLLLSKF